MALLVEFLSDLIEHFQDSGAILGQRRRLKTATKLQLFFLLLHVVELYKPAAFHVALVTAQEFDRGRVTDLLHVGHVLVNALEGVVGVDAVHDEHGVRTREESLVVGLRALVARCVPDIQLQSGAVWQLHEFVLIFDSDRGLSVPGECVVQELVDNGRFANVGIANHHDFISFDVFVFSLSLVLLLVTADSHCRILII